jgi:hypothetical protein
LLLVLLPSSGRTCMASMVVLLNGRGSCCTKESKLQLELFCESGINSPSFLTKTC